MDDVDQTEELEGSERVLGLPQRNSEPDNVSIPPPFEIKGPEGERLPVYLLSSFGSWNICDDCWKALLPL